MNKAEKIDRKFTPEWYKSGKIDTSKIGDYVKAMDAQIQSMVNYIETLHNKIDYSDQENKELVELLKKVVEYDNKMIEYDSYYSMPTELKEEIQKAIR